MNTMIHMDTAQPKHDDLDTNARDWLVSSMSAVAGAAPVVGSILQQVVGLIPKQRSDRMVDYVRRLEGRVTNIEVFRSSLQDERGADIAEKGLRQSAHSLSEERRQHIANLIANTLGSVDVDYQEQRFLLKLLGEINDTQIILLTSYIRGGSFDTKAFSAQHAALLERSNTYSGSSREKYDDATMQEGLKKELAELGLLKFTYKVESQRSEGGPL